jgi:hypothetical protein
MSKGLMPVIKATAIEILSSPLTLLLLLAALTLAVLAPAFHYHQFGEATRMARDAGFSAIFTCGTAVAVFCTIQAFRSEIESGTLQMALSHPISRASFFVSKMLGAFVAYFVFTSIVFFTSLTIIEGARIGGVIARQTGDIARLHGPYFAAGVSIMLMPLILGAMLNRFLRFRFVLSANIISFVLASLAVIVSSVFNYSLFSRYLPVAVLLMMPACVFVSAAAAFATRLPANAAAASCGVLIALSVPSIGNYYMSNALSNGGVVSWSYVAMAAVAAAPALAAFIILGVWFMGKRDVS